MTDDTKQFIAVGDAKICCCVDGPADAPVVLLSHALGADMSMWAPQLPALTRFRVLRYDTRGHGASSVTPGPYTIGLLGRDVIALLDGLGIARAHFCGISMGGVIGLWLGVNAADRVERLVLCNTAAKLGSPDVWNTRIANVTAGGMTAISAGVIDRWFTAAYRTRESRVVAATKATVERTRPAGYLACCAAGRDVDLRDAVASIRAPTLVIGGTRDVSVPAAATRALAESIPGARYVELDAPHLSNVEAAPRFNETLLDFLGSGGA